MRSERPFFVGFREGWRYNRRYESFAVTLGRSLSWGLTYRVHPGVRRRALMRDVYVETRYGSVMPWQS